VARRVVYIWKIFGVFLDGHELEIVFLGRERPPLLEWKGRLAAALGYFCRLAVAGLILTIGSISRMGVVFERSNWCWIVAVVNGRDVVLCLKEKENQDILSHQG